MSKWSDSPSIYNTQIPTTSRQRVRERHQGRCERCGGTGSQWHHRRSRSVVEEHRHCPCNGLWLCATCHSEAHTRPTMAKMEGIIVPRWVHNPGSCGFRNYQGRWVVLDCEGNVSTVESKEE